MFRPRQSLFVLALVFSFVATPVTCAEAGHGRRRWHRAIPRPPSRIHATSRAPDNRQQHRFPDDDWFYPRYTGAFHARYFNQFGYPTGDHGIRGTAW